MHDKQWSAAANKIFHNLNLMGIDEINVWQTYSIINNRTWLGIFNISTGNYNAINQEFRIRDDSIIIRFSLIISLIYNYYG